jgi:hypothetical protein
LPIASDVRASAVYVENRRRRAPPPIPNTAAIAPAAPPTPPAVGAPLGVSVHGFGY